MLETRSPLVVVPGQRTSADPALDVAPQQVAPAVSDVSARLLSGADDDSAAYLRELRDRSPLLRSRSGWVSASHGVCAAVLADDEVFVPDAGAEAPEHGEDRHYAVLADVLAPSSVARLRFDVEGWVDGLIDGLPAGAHLDLTDDFAAPLAAMLVGEVLGVPAKDWLQLREWIERLVPADGGSHHRDVVRARHAVRRYLHDLLDRRRRGELGGVADAMVDDLVHERHGSDALTQHEAGAAALSLLVSGYETIHAMTAATINALLQHPEQVESLIARPGAWFCAVDEVARWDPVVLVAVRRAVSLTGLVGYDVSPGERLLLSIAGANRDPQVFDDPDMFDVDRDGVARHLTFATGIHGRIGAGLGRLAAEVAAARLFERYPNVRASGRARRVVRGYVKDVSSLPVRLGRAAGS